VDFFCKEVGIVIELDGISHHFEVTIDKDEQKQSYLENLGLKVLRFDDEEVMNDMRNVLRVIEQYLQ
jgi:very-short-patch-repair endonuclease